MYQTYQVIKSGFLFILLALSLVACSGQQYASDELIGEALKAQPDVIKEYVLGPSDIVQVSVWRNPDLSATVPIRPDGRISVPLVGDIQASGLAPETLARHIEKRLEIFLRQPQVSVVVTDMASYEFTSRVRVTGAVVAPISIPYRSGMTILDLVLTAGGANEFAALHKATLYRTLKGKSVAIPVHLDEILYEGDIVTNYLLLPGDILTVPERSF